MEKYFLVVKNVITVLSAPEMMVNDAKSIYTDEAKIEKIDEDQRNELLSRIDELASQGYKVLAVTFKVVSDAVWEISYEKISENSILLALVAFSDPIRNDVHSAIDEVQKAPKLLDVVHQLSSQIPQFFILSGSSARKLKHGGANLLAGRAFVFHLLLFFDIFLCLIIFI